MQPFLDEARLRALHAGWAKDCGKRLRRRRLELRYTQQTLAPLVGVRHATISKAELGEIVPKDSVQLAIAFALLCEVTDLWPPIPRAELLVARADVEPVAS